MTSATTWGAGPVYQTSIIVGVTAVAVVAVLHTRASRRRPSEVAGAPRVGRIGKLSWLWVAACVLVLGATAFGAVLSTGSMHGYLLMLHTSVGIALTVAVAAFALAGAAANRSGSAAGYGGATRATFWLMLLLAMIAAGSMLVSMFPWIGTDGMAQLLTVHRWSGLGLFVATALHAIVRRGRGG